MWFKQIQPFQLSDSFKYSKNTLEEKLELLTFASCLPSMPYSAGWISPIDENGPLVRSINNYTMLCLQIEEKILPATVVNQELSEVIKQIETSENRKLRPKEKYALKDEIIITLLPRAFSRLTKIYAYIDSKNHRLILGTANPKKSEQFFNIFKKLFSEEIKSIEIKKLSSIMTNWLKNKNYPSSFSIEKACVLQDPSQENRIIRCKHQDLFATGIQSLIKDGCEAIQLALTWQDQVTFVLANDFSLNSIQFQDEILEQVKEMEPGSEQQQFDADFLIMTEVLSSLINDLLKMTHDSRQSEKANNLGQVIPMVKASKQ